MFLIHNFCLYQLTFCNFSRPKNRCQFETLIFPPVEYFSQKDAFPHKKRKKHFLRKHFFLFSTFFISRLSQTLSIFPSLSHSDSSGPETGQLLIHPHGYSSLSSIQCLCPSDGSYFRTVYPDGYCRPRFRLMSAQRPHHQELL